MGYPLQAVSANAIAAVLLISLLANYHGKYHHANSELRIFCAMVVVNLLQCIIEPITIVLDGRLFPGAVPLLRVLNALLYGNNIVFAALWSVYADVRVQAIKSSRSKFYYLKFLPAALIMIGTAANLFTPVFFQVSDENIYTRTNLFILPYIATYFYLVLGTFSVYRFGRKGSKYVFLPALTFLLPVVIASLIQFFCTGISLLWVGAAIGLNSAYMCLLDESSSIDTLSGAFSRHYMNQHLSTLHRLPGSGKTVAGIMLDVDKFKSINDEFGHLVGDDAISKIGWILREATKGRGTVFRYAGDEFVIILTITSHQEIDTIVSQILAETDRFNASGLAPYQIRFSIGHTLYLPGESTRDFLQRIDDAMYSNKKQKKH